MLCYLALFVDLLQSFQPSSQLTLSFSFDEFNPDRRHLSLESVDTNGLKVSNHWKIFTRSIKSLLSRNVPSSTCGSLAVCFDPESSVIASLTSAHLCLDNTPLINL